MRSQRANFRGFCGRFALRAGRSSFSPHGKLPFPREKVRKKVVGLGKGSLVARQCARAARERPERFRPTRRAPSAGAGHQPAASPWYERLISPVCFVVLAGYRRGVFGIGPALRIGQHASGATRSPTITTRCRVDGPDGPRPELERYALLIAGRRPMCSTNGRKSLS